MKQWMKVLFIMVTSLSILILAACGKQETILDKVKQDKTLRVGTDATFAPFEFKNSKHEYDGFDVELIKAVAKEMGANKVQFVDTEFKSLIPGLQAKKFDVIVSAMYKTPEREKVIAFSDSYYPGGLSIMVKQDNQSIHGPEDLKGKKVAVQEGTKSVEYMKENYPDVQLVPVEKNVEMFLQLESGRVDAVVTGKPAAKVYVMSHPTVKVLDQTLTHEEYCYGIRSKDKDLIKAINEALKKVKASGEYAKLTKKWFGE